MSIAEIKERLHQIIDNSDNEQWLEQLLSVVEEEANGKDIWDELTPAQQRSVNIALEQIKDPSQCIPHEEAMKQFQEWKKTLK